MYMYQVYLFTTQDITSDPHGPFLGFRVAKEKDALKAAKELKKKFSKLQARCCEVSGDGDDGRYELKIS